MISELKLTNNRAAFNHRDAETEISGYMAITFAHIDQTLLILVFGFLITLIAIGCEKYSNRKVVKLRNRRNVTRRK